jgi:hypothetical protein
VRAENRVVADLDFVADVAALAASWPSTRATPTYSAMLRMVRFSVTSSSSLSPGTTIFEKRALSTFTR